MESPSELYIRAQSLEGPERECVGSVVERAPGGLVRLTLQTGAEMGIKRVPGTKVSFLVCNMTLLALFHMRLHRLDRLVKELSIPRTSSKLLRTC